MVFKCKLCGGELDIEINASIATCQYCGSQQTLPKLNNDKKSSLYDRANQFRRQNEFDKAAALFEQVLNEDANDAEAYWSLVLCKYGVEYVEDPKTNKRIPTCNRTQILSILSDSDYKEALRHADTSQKALYEAEAAQIDGIQKGILEISQKESAFDIFICYKETDENGRRTQDSVLGADLYHQLTNEGYKVFFSKITLENILGTAYEPYIFAALQSSSVMIVIGTKPEYFQATWVRNEWSRYLALIKTGAKKILIPAYRDMDPYNLPQEFANLQAQDMGKLGFVQDLVRGIKKIAGKENASASQASGNAAPNEQNLLKRIGMFITDEDYDSADSYCSQVLDINADNPMVYFYKTLIDFVKNPDSKKYGQRLQTILPEPSEEEKAFMTAETDLICALAFISAGLSSRLKYLLSRYPELLELNINDDKNPRMPLFNYAICYAPQHLSVIRVLLEAGADANSYRTYKNKHGSTNHCALSNAIWSAKSPALVKLLLEFGADPNTKESIINDNGKKFDKTMLSFAVIEANSSEIVKILLEHGADVKSYRVYNNNYGSFQYSAFGDAIWNTKNLEMVKLFLDHGADPNHIERLTGDDGIEAVKTMLTCAIADAKSPEMVELLLSKGAHWNNKILYGSKKKEEGKYPFHKECNLSPDFVDFLKSKGWKGYGLFG